MKKILFYFNVFMLAILTLSIYAENVKKSNTQKGEISQSWFEQAMANIEKDEYKISLQNDEYHSTNFAQNLEFRYFNHGFSVRLHNTNVGDKSLKEWNAYFITLGFGRGNKIIYSFKGNNFSSELNKAEISDNNLEINYLNNKKGMRQNFIVKKKPTNKKGLLKLRFNILTDQNVIVGANALMIKDAESILMKYKELKVWDATGKELRGWFESIKNKNANSLKELAICVNDANAKYPITIDPISTTEDWSKEGENDSDEFGTSVATAGDVNGDGRSDIIIGAPNYDNGYSDAGKVYVYYGGTTGPSTTADWTYEGSSAGENVGKSVATAGDMNGDGYSDVIIGAPGYNSATGRVYIFLSQGVSGLNSSPDVTFNGEANSYCGISVAPAGDFNGDGYSDVIFGAPLYNDGSTEEEGKTYVVFGETDVSNIINNEVWSVEGNNTYMELGFSVNFAGDIDKDGYSDIIIGAPGYDDGADTDKGIIFVFHGEDADPGASPATLPSTIYEAVVLGENAGDKFGYSVSTAGDITGDGYSDVIVGAPYHDSDEGKAYVFYGSSSSISTTPNWTYNSFTSDNLGYSVGTAGDVNGDGFGDVIYSGPDYGTHKGLVFVNFGSSSGMPYHGEWEKTGSDTYIAYGNSVATAGDVNGDGFSDIIIGAYKKDADTNNDSDDGEAYVYFGSATGVSATASWNYVSESSSTGFGYGLATAGDVNGDGYTDVIIGDPNYDSNRGKVYLFKGSTSGISSTVTWSATGEATNQSFGYSVATAGDVNGDGYSDVIIGAPEYESDGSSTDEGKVYIYYGSNSSPYLSSTPDWTSEYDVAGYKLGFSVSTAGDVNGDGYSDIIYSMPYYTNGQTEEGAFVIGHGSSSGISGGITVESDLANALLGYSVSFAGDLNGDIYSDIVVGAKDYTNGESNEGKVFVYTGSSSGISSTANWGIEANTVGASLGVSVACAGDVNGDGLTDIIVGANGGDGLALVLYGDNTTVINSTYTTLTGTTGSAFGSSVSSAGDVDGNGYSDVIVGAPLHNNQRGAAYIYQSDVSGLSTTAAWSIEGDADSDEYGTKVTVAGDVDGNGYSDVLTYTPNISGGAVVYSFYGNEGRNGEVCGCMSIQPSSTTPITAGGLSNSEDSYAIRTIFSTPLGQTKARILYEEINETEAFSSGSSITNNINYDGNGPWITATGGLTPVYKTVSDMSDGHEYFWRERSNYQKVVSPYILYGPWRYYNIYMPAPWGGVKPKPVDASPVELTSFMAKSVGKSIILTWNTATEINNYGFEIERASFSTTPVKTWETIGFVDGHGNSNSPNNYSFVDTEKLSGTVQYRLKQIDFDGGFEYSDVVTVELSLSKEYKLAQNYPNPFNPTTVIEFTIPKMKSEMSNVKLVVSNILGEEVATLINKPMASGNYSVSFDASNLPSGIYFYSIFVNGFTEVKKMNLIK